MDRDLDQINVIPLVDVMLVLLVIVLTTATFISTGQIPIDLAKAKHATAAIEQPVVLTLKNDGALFLNQQAISVDGLGAALGAYAKETAVVVRADRTTPLERFVTLVDTVKGLGYTKVSLQVERS
ncbi:MAG: biopolymer transporter ExbD [Gammaproteobacteria bacterium]